MDHLRTVPVPSSLDAALLYELTLSAGTSLELVANCQTFLRALLGRLGFDFGAVWLRSRYLTQGHRPEGYALVAAVPEAYIREIHLPETHPLFEHLGDRTAWVVPGGDDAFGACVTEVGVKRGTYAIHLLGTFGFLKLYARPKSPPVDEATLLALKRVLLYFTDSIERSLAYQYQLDEVDERVQTERRLRLTLARLVALIGSLTTGVLLEDESLEVVLANEAFCGLLGLSDTPQALIGLRRRRLIQRLRDRLADPAEALWQLGTLADRQRPATGLRVQTADGQTLAVDYAPVTLEGFTGHLWQYRQAAAPQLILTESTAVATGPFLASGLSTPDTPPDAGQAIRFDLNDLVHRTLEALREEAAPRAVVIEPFLSPQLPGWLVGDAEGLAAALRELVTNAMRHTDAERVALTALPVEQRNGQFRVQFAVSDTGAGMTREALDAAFEGSSERGIPRLARWAQARHGHLSAQSMPGRGSVFTLVLPFHNEDIFGV